MAGYLEKRGKNSWRLTVSNGFDMYDNRIKHQKIITATSKTGANKQLDLYVAEV